MTTPKIDLEIFDTEQSFADIGLDSYLQKAVEKLWKNSLSNKKFG